MLGIVKVFIVAVMVAAIVSASPEAHGAGRLHAGVAKADITPTQPVVSAQGESFRLPDDVAPGDRIAPDAILDPLYARVVAEAKRRWGVDHVLLNPSHTHAGAVTRGMCSTNGGWGGTFAKADPGEKLDWESFAEDPWYAATEDKIIDAMGAAAHDMFPARLAVGHTRHKSGFMAHNRRLVRPDGTGTTMWSNPDRILTALIDPTLGVIRIDDDAGNPRVVMVHYACHPVMLMGAGKVSRDFPGAMVDHVEQEAGNSCMAMLLQGALGDLDPCDCALRGERGFAMVRRAGTELGQAALRLMKELGPTEPEATLRIRKNMVTVRNRTGDKTSRVCLLTAVFDRNSLSSVFPANPSSSII